MLLTAEGDDDDDVKIDAKQDKLLIITLLVSLVIFVSTLSNGMSFRVSNGGISIDRLPS